MSGELVTVNGEPMRRGYAPTTDAHISGIPILRPPKAQRVIATRRGKAARRRANSRVNVRRVRAGGKSVTGERFLAHVWGCEAENA